MSSPKVSVIVTAHNYAEYLRECLDSVVNQTYEDYELVVVDDGSTDETPEILREYSYEYPNTVRVITLEGRGLSTACNRGIQAADGEYVIRLDADDFFDENILTVESSYLESNPEIDLVYPDYYTVNEEGEIIDHVRLPKVGEEVKLLDRSPLAAGAMYRKSAWEEIGGYDESLNYQEDYDFWIKFTAQFDVHNVNLPLMYYRQHGESMSTNFSARMNARRNVKREFVEKRLDSEKFDVLGVIPAMREARIEPPDGEVEVLALEKVGSKPLIEFSIKEAQAADHLDRVLVSTEDEAIAEQSREAGAEVPFLRDPALSSTTTQLSDVMTSMLERLRKDEGYKPDFVVILPYITPLRTARQIDEAVDTALMFSVDSVISVTENKQFLWQPGTYGLEPLFDERLLRRERETTYHENGAIYVSTPDTIYHHDDLVGQHIGHILMQRKTAVHIDSWYDFRICRDFVTAGNMTEFTSPMLTND